MPIRLTIFHPDRMIIGVATDKVTLFDLVSFFREIAESNTLHYRKLIDVASAEPSLSKEELAGWSMVSQTPSGPLRHLGPVVRLSETKPHWARPSVPLGYHQPVWPPRGTA